MRLQTMKTTDFLAIKEAEITFENLTLLYGANGSGKTSLADAVRFAFSGKAPRERRIPEVVRDGAASSAVELEVLGVDEKKTTITRMVDSKTSDRFLDGVDVSAAEFSAEVARRFGASERTIDAALRAGALFDMKEEELLAFLLALVGAELDEKTVRAAFSKAVVEAAERAKLKLPGTLQEFGARTAVAVDQRKRAKREVERLKGDLERMPAPSGPAPATREEVEKEIAKLEGEKVKSAHATGVAEGELSAKRARLVELRAKVEDKPKGGEDAEKKRASLAESQGRDLQRLGEIRARLGVGREKAGALEKMAKGAKPAAGAVAGAAERFKAATAAAEAGRRSLQEKKAKGAELAVLVKSGKDGCQHGCEVHCPDVEALERELLAARTAYAKEAEAQKAVEAELEAATAARTGAEEAEAAAELEPVLAGIAKLEAEAKELEKRGAACAEELEKLEKTAAAFRAWKSAGEELAKVEADLAAVTNAATSTPAADVEKKLAEAKLALRLFDAVADRKRVEASLEEAKQAVTDTDAVAEACGPGGKPRLALLEKALAPFRQAANDVLGGLAEGLGIAFATDGAFELRVVKNGHPYPPASISDGERTRLLYVLQFVVARLAKVGLVILDRAELMDDPGRKATKRLVGHWIAGGGQVVMLTCAEPPKAALPAGVVAYLVKNGVFEKVSA